MKTHSSLYKTRLMTRVFGAILAVACLPALADTLDNFNSGKVGWYDTLNGGVSTVAGGVFKLTSGAADGTLTSSAKTNASFVIQANHTLEFRVDVLGARPPTPDTNALAVLAWVPTNTTIAAGGYRLMVGAADVKVMKGATSLLATNYGFQNTNITMVIRMTPAGSAMNINVRLYKRQDVGQNLFFEWTVTDPSGLINVGGNAVLGVLNQANPSASDVTFDTLLVFDMTTTVIDNFNRANTIPAQGYGPAWLTLYQLNGGASPDREYLVNNQAFIDTSPFQAAGLAVYAAKTYNLQNNVRVEFQVDVATNTINGDSYTVLGYLPALTASYLQSVRAYHIATVSGPFDSTVFVGKEYNKWWGFVDDPSFNLTNSNYRLIQTYTGEGTSLRIDSRIEDLNVDVNDTNRIRFQNIFVDTVGQDATAPNIDNFNGGGAYTNFSGFFLLECFNAGNITGTQSLFDNATVSQTVPPNNAPFFSGVTPVADSAFIPNPSALELNFHVIDDTNTPLNNIVLTLNGVRYTNGHPNVAITPTGATATDRFFRLTNVFVPNVYYSGTIQATDNAGLAATPFAVRFDTFTTSGGALVYECEDYNFESGNKIDNPILIAEPNTDTSAYNGKVGTPDVDWHDNRCDATCVANGPPSFAGGYGPDHYYRYDDAVRTSHSTDSPRAQYISAGGTAAGFYEIILSDIRDGDWENYTHTFPAGTYNVYLRYSLFQLALPQALVTLERVTGDRTLPNQATTPLGSFIAGESGFGAYRTVPLTDGLGNPAVVKFSGGLDTVRLSQRVTGNDDDNVGILAENYFVFAPTTPVATLRPFISQVSPLPNSTYNAVFPTTSATIANRDTTVKTNTIVLKINGVTVSPTIVSNATGATVSYALTPLPPPGTQITNNLSFADSDNVFQTNIWVFTLTYPFLPSSSKLPLGALSVRGFAHRTAWTFNNGQNLANTLGRAEQQLARPPLIPLDIYFETNIVTLDWNDDNGTPQYVPGLEGGGYNNIATEDTGYMELTAGPHRFHVWSDDGFQVRSGQTTEDPNAVVLGFNNGTFNSTFDFVAESAGLYPIRNVWFETGGSAYYHIWSVDLTGANPEALLNDPNNPAGVVKVYLEIPPEVTLWSSSTANGLYTQAVAAVDPINKTVTSTITDAAQFYRLNGATAPVITKIQKVGPNMVINYHF